MWESPRFPNLALALVGIACLSLGFFSVPGDRTAVTVTFLVCGTVLLSIGGVLDFFTHRRNPPS
jgi:hypothetical protein